MSLPESEIIWQGLSPKEFEGLSVESQDFVVERSRSFRKVKEIKIALEFLEEMSEDVGVGGSGFLKKILSGESPEGEKILREIVSKYLNSDKSQSVKEYYQTNFKGKFLDYVAERMDSNKSGIQDPRVVEVAILLSEWEDRVPEKIIKTEIDIIQRILDIADETKDLGLTEREITLAAKELVGDEFHEAEFHLEALQPGHREELIKRALKHVKGGSDV